MSRASAGRARHAAGTNCGCCTLLLHRRGGIAIVLCRVSLRWPVSSALLRLTRLSRLTPVLLHVLRRYTIPEYLRSWDL